MALESFSWRVAFDDFDGLTSKGITVDKSNRVIHMKRYVKFHLDQDFVVRLKAEVADAADWFPFAINRIAFMEIFDLLIFDIVRKLGDVGV